MIGPCVALGAATFIMQASESVISVCFNSSLQNYGGDIAVGAMTILTSVMQFAMLPLQGLGQGAQPIISYCYGAGGLWKSQGGFPAPAESQHGLRGILWALVMLFPGVFAAMFTTSPELIAYTGDCPADLHGGHVPLRNPDGLPDDLLTPWAERWNPSRWRLCGSLSC